MTKKDLSQIQELIRASNALQFEDIKQFTLATVSQSEARLESRIEEIMDQKLDEKLEQKLEEKLETKLEEKLGKKFAEFRDEIVSGVNQTIEPIIEMLDNHESRIQRLERRKPRLSLAKA
jgi:hypothetical protein